MGVWRPWPEDQMQDSVCQITEVLILCHLSNAYRIFSLTNVSLSLYFLLIGAFFLFHPRFPFPLSSVPAVKAVLTKDGGQRSEK
ncbi:hypothetical protein H671_5g13458 [Cricetulus griseus]|nr:hypothetical protein H671_5g13458 [Cricetulus griseus]